MIIFICAILWITVGISSLVFDWTSEFDATYPDLIMCTMVGTVLGPFAFIVFVLPRLFSKVVIKKRRKQ